MTARSISKLPSSVKWLLGGALLLAVSQWPMAQSTPTITNFAVSAPAISPQLHAQLDWTSPNDGAFDSYKVTYQSTGLQITATYNLTGSDSAALNGALYSTTGVGRPMQAPGAADRMIIVGLKPNTAYTITMQACTSNQTFCGPAVSQSYTTAKYEGYGYLSVGGGEQKFCAVTSLADAAGGCTCTGSNPGVCTGSACTLRGCTTLSPQNGAYVVFCPVGTACGDNFGTGTIGMSDGNTPDFRINNVTIDGSAAPAPGVTISTIGTDSNHRCDNDGFKLGACHLSGCGGAGSRHDQIETYLRFTGNDAWGASGCSCPCASNCRTDCGSCESCDDGTAIIGTTSGTVGSNIVMNHLTIRSFGDAACDLSGHHSGVSWSYNFCELGSHVQLISPSGSGHYASNAASIHHNLYARNGQRMPYIAGAHTNYEFTNNIVWDYGYDPLGSARGYLGGGYGMQLQNEFPTEKVDMNVVNNWFRAFVCTGITGCNSNSNKATEWGTGAGCDANENDSCSTLCSQGVNCTNTSTGAGCSPASSTCCGKQGETVNASSHVKLGNLYVSGNTFPALNCDEYGTVNSANALTDTNAAITTDTAANLEVTVLPTVGTWYRTSGSVPPGDEQAYITSVATAMRPELAVDGGFESGGLAAGGFNVTSPCSCTFGLATVDGTAPITGSYSMRLAAYPFNANCSPMCAGANYNLTGLTVGRIYTVTGNYHWNITDTSIDLLRELIMCTTSDCSDLANTGGEPRSGIQCDVTGASAPFNCGTLSGPFSFTFTATSTSVDLKWLLVTGAGILNDNIQIDDVSIR